MGSGSSTKKKGTVKLEEEEAPNKSTESEQKKAVISLKGGFVVFGDSYSDDGNNYMRSGGHWPRGVFKSKCYSDGLTWAAQLENKYVGDQVLVLAHGGATCLDSTADGTMSYTSVPQYEDDAEKNAALAEVMKANGCKLVEQDGVPPGEWKYQQFTPSVGTQVKWYCEHRAGGDCAEVPEYVKTKLDKVQFSVAEMTHVIVAGFNDYFFEIFQKDANVDLSDMTDGLLRHLTTLFDAGARKFVVADIPSMSLTPYGFRTKAEFDSAHGKHKAWVQRLVNQWSRDHPDALVLGWGMYDLCADRYAVALEEKLFAHVTESMFAKDPYGPYPDNLPFTEQAAKGALYMFADDYHPSEAMHTELLNSFEAVVKRQARSTIDADRQGDPWLF